ncbi:MAG TPA: magnesium-translocating P-type ATPase [bacterium]|nr:magnesium-translocating P-type ATPase [bacterium]
MSDGREAMPRPHPLQEPLSGAPGEDMHPVPLASLFDRVRTSDRGLTSEEARHRLDEVGPNDPTPARHKSALLELAALFANPLVLILLIASAVSGVLGEIVSASIIVIIVLLSAGLNFVQTYRARRAAEDLRARVAPTATVLRDGGWQEIPRRDVVPGDIIRLVAGDLVPADARLIEARDLHVQESALTGESMPAEKMAEAEPSAVNAVFLGTSVVSGTARAVVTATGRATAFGDIAVRLAARAPETEFDRGSRQFGFFIMRTVFFLVLFVFLTGAALRHNPLESFLFAVALAVGLTPENLPMITAVTLGQGAVRMARLKVVVKHLSAIQNFGSIDILCSDKTGTLTSGEMVLDQRLDPRGNPSERPFVLAWLNSSFQTGIKSPLDAAILSNGSRTPSDTAVPRGDQADVQVYQKVDEMPFDFERRRLSVVVEKDGRRLLITKGAPEGVLALSKALEVDGAARPFDAEARRESEAVCQRLSNDGFRVLAVAYRAVPQQDAYHAADERDLVLAGFLAFVDPPLEDADEVLGALRRDGVTVKILTGDSEPVARHVCTQVGLDPGRCVVGDELATMNDSALAAVAERTTVFARVSPAQKNRILLALKRRGHVVGFLGDGINDAPSLHAADVGISVATGADVAKDAADIILLERSLRVLHQGILEGRKAFGNVMKYLLMGTSSNFGNMFSMAGASLFLPFLPMLPTQILLNNFLYDFAQVTIPTDNVDETLTQKPRTWNIAMIRDFMLYIGPISSIYDFLTFYVLLRIFHASQALFHTGWFVESLATQTLVLFVIRTAGNPLRSRPSGPLATTTVLVVLIGIVLPFTALAKPLGFVPVTGAFLAFVAIATTTYLLLVEAAKHRLMRSLVI